MQKVGQATLAIGRVVPLCGQGELVQGLAQHGQHALGLPDGAQRAQLFAALVKGLVVVGQPAQRVQAQAQRGGGQAGAHQAHVLRVGHGAQPMNKVVRLGAVKHRVAVGQIDRGHAPALQRLSHRAGLFAGAHQDGDIGRAQAGERGVCGTVGAGKAGVRVPQPGHDLGGAYFRKALAHVQAAVDIKRVHQRHGG